MVQPGRTPNALMSPEDAVEIGYEVGRNLCLAGAGKKIGRGRALSEPAPALPKFEVSEGFGVVVGAVTGVEIKYEKCETIVRGTGRPR